MFSKKKTECRVCGYRFTPERENIYTAEEPRSALEMLTAAPKRFSAVDCPICGCQIRLADRAPRIDLPAITEQHDADAEETDDTPEEKRLFTETPIQCPFCEGENSNARVYEDKQNKEYFVYCQKCGIETKDTFTSKAKAVKAFTEGKTKKVTGSEVADE